MPTGAPLPLHPPTLEPSGCCASPTVAPMYLIADAQCLQSPDSRDRGIGRYARNLLNAIAAARPDWRIEAVENSRLAGIDRTSVDVRIVVTPFEPLLDIQPAARQANDRFFG